MMRHKQSGRCQTGQVYQCGVRPASYRTCGHQGCPHDSLLLQEVNLCPQTISWFPTRKRELAKSHKACTRCCCAHCGAPSEHESGTCIVTMQYDEEDETCLVYQADIQRREL